MAGPTECVALLMLLVGLSYGKAIQDESMELRMPEVQPKEPDTYLCTPKKMDPNAPTYLTGFEAHANMSIAHHILLYGCEEPGKEDGVWDCGEMMTAESRGYEMGPVCQKGAQIVYAWAMDAPLLVLPKDVAFKVGGSTKIKWLVLQVHYKDVTSFLPPANNKDHSGLTVTATSVPQPKLAGVYLLGTGGEIPAHSTTYMETACGFSDPFIIHPFAYRVHAHTHGVVTAGYRVRDNKWEEIGRASPQKPQMFYPVTHPGMTVKPGDVLAARCTMVNNDDKKVVIGNTQNDEMCNFYIMYWVDGERTMSQNYCFSPGPPKWFWGDFMGIHSDDIPISASIVPGTNKLLKATQEFMNDAEKTMKQANLDMEGDFVRLLEKMREDEPEMELNPMFEKYGLDIKQNLMDGPKYENMIEENPAFGNQELENEVFPGYQGNRFEEQEPELYYEQRINEE